MTKGFFSADASALDTKEVLGAFVAYGIERRLVKGQLLYLTGEDARQIYYLHTGRVFFCYTQKDGTQHPLGIIPAPFFIGEEAFFDRVKRTADLMAATDCVLYAMSVSTLFSLMEKSPLLMRQVTILFAREAMHAGNLLGALTQTTAMKKAAAYLASSGHILGSRISDLTKESLAAYLGITRSTASRILNRFQRDGLIKLGYSSITILDPQGLIDVCNAGEEA